VTGQRVTTVRARLVAERGAQGLQPVIVDREALAVAAGLIGGR